MNPLIDPPVSARHANGDIIVHMKSGIEFSFPCSAYPRLASATETVRANLEVSPMGIHRPDIDERTCPLAAYGATTRPSSEMTA